MDKLVEEVSTMLVEDSYLVDTALASAHDVTLTIHGEGQGYVLAHFETDKLTISQRSGYESFADETYERLGGETIENPVNSMAVYRRIVANIQAARLVSIHHQKRFAELFEKEYDARRHTTEIVAKALGVSHPEHPYTHLGYVFQGVNAYFTIGKESVTIEIDASAEYARRIAELLFQMEGETNGLEHGSDNS